MIGTIEQELALCREAFAGVEVGALAWCIHHDKLVEPLTQPVEDRIRCIMKYKPERERACRLHNMRPVRGELPVEVVTAGQAYVTAWQAYVTAWQACVTAWQACGGDTARQACVTAWQACGDTARQACVTGQAYDTVIAQHHPAIMALHLAEVPGTTWDGKTIFGDLGSPPSAATRDA